VQALLAGRRSKTRIELACRFELPQSVVVTPALQSAGYRICEAALANAIRHSTARRATVELIARHGRLIVRISDDGCGFEPAPARSSKWWRRSGLEKMAEWAKEAGGRLEVRSAPGAGTCISAFFPLPASRGD
jgi:signal transduction histidine kinase